MNVDCQIDKNKLNHSSAGIEIYKLPPTLTKETFERTEGPYRSGITKKYSNKRSGEKIAKFKAGTMAQSGLACFHISRLLGHLVEVPPATYRTMDFQEFQKVGEQAPNDWPSELHVDLGRSASHGEVRQLKTGSA